MAVVYTKYLCIVRYLFVCPQLQIRTFDDFSTLRSVSDLADGVVLHRVMNAV